MKFVGLCVIIFSDHLNDVDFDDYAAALMDQPPGQNDGKRSASSLH